MAYTESKLIHAFYSKNYHRYEIVVDNMYVYNSFSESDIFAVRPSGFCDEIEVKLSKSDFNADFSKVIIRNCSEQNKHTCIKDGSLGCNYFSFLIPESIENEIEIPEYSGLYVAKINDLGILSVSERKKPKKLHTRKISIDKKYKMLKKLQYRYWR